MLKSTTATDDNNIDEDEKSVQTLSEDQSSSERTEFLLTIPPFFKVDGKRIRRRIKLNELKVGQKIQGVKLEHDCLLGKTGPKVFLDCGIAKYNPDRKEYNKAWTRVNGMLRIGSKYEKKSLHRKRASKLSKKGLTDVYVSRIFLENGQFEVSLENPIDNDRRRTKDKGEETKYISMSSIQPNTEYVGKVKRIESYGVLVDIGANRLGLLHIKKVSDLYKRYIPKEKGLEGAGLELGAKIRVQVIEKDKKRIFLDFTNDVKEDAIAEANETPKEEEKEIENTDDYLSEEEAAKWAEFAAGDSSEEDDYDDYYDASEWEEFATESNNDDEDRKIEDALGLGSY